MPRTQRAPKASGSLVKGEPAGVATDRGSEVWFVTAASRGPVLQMLGPEQSSQTATAVHGTGRGETMCLVKAGGGFNDLAKQKVP